MHLKIVIHRSVLTFGIPVVWLAGFVSIGSLFIPSAWAQEDSGVKIALTLTPSNPAQPKPPATNAAAPAQPAIESTLKGESATNKTQTPFVLSAFQLVSDNGPKPEPLRTVARPESELSLEQPPSPLPRPQQAASPVPTTPVANKSEHALVLESALSKATAPGRSKEIKPFKISEPKDTSDNENAGDGNAECPGGTEGSKPLPALPDDIPLEQEDHPYDAPAAESSSSKPDRPVARTPIQLSSEQLRLRTEINQLLRYYIQHPETIARRSPWAVMHAILPFGVEAELSAGNRRVNAIGWMSYNGLCKTQRIFQPTKTGFRTNLGPGVQGHEGQFLAILAQSKVAPTYPIKVGSRNYTVNDLVRLEMATCRERSELTFKLLGLSYYLDQNQRWRDNQGGNWTLEKIVGEELDQPVVGAACGGTHRLMGLTFSLMQRKQAGLPIDGHWNRSEQFLNDFVAYAFSLQNPDGSFSTEWFEARANDPEIERKVQTTGHILEWLIYTLPDDQLQSAPVQKALRFLLNTIGGEPGRDWPIGPRGHSLRALALYNQRVFGAPPGKLKQYIANLNTESKQR